MASRRGTRWLGWAIACLWFGAAGMVDAATITIINLDPPGQGLNDPTPAAPVGGNPGVTVGAQRLAVFQQAASIWGGILTSSVGIMVEASFTPLSCNATSGVLGGAGPNFIYWDFTNAPFPATSYSEAQANRLATFDLNPGGADIGSVFNSEIGKPGCLEASSWYYGLDHLEGMNQIDLLAVVLHEMGHGLGFYTLIDDNTGEALYGIPDIYSRFILDQKTGLHWNEETNAERAASDTATYRVVWDGSFVRNHATSLLGARPLLQVNAPPGVAGEKYVGVATFGAALTSTGLSGDAVLADDGVAPTSNACEALVNAGQVAGKIALIDRGQCTFILKVKNCQNAGAIGVIVVNDLDGTDPVGMSGIDPTITIPSVRVTKADGDALRAVLASGVNVTMRTDPTRYAGADATGNVMLFAPNPNAPGSSISHWDVSCGPNLLMEPNINSDLTSDIDLTRWAFYDMGWFPGATDVSGRPAAPSSVLLAANAPNPFRASTVVRFELTEEGLTDLAVYDVSGRLVKHLVHRPLPAGAHETVWDGTDESGRRVEGGVYFSRLVVADAVRSRRMLVVR